MKKVMFVLSLILIATLFSCRKPSDCWKCKTWENSQHPAETDPIITYHKGWTEEQIKEYINANTIVTLDTIQGKTYYVYHKETRCSLEN